MSYYRYGQPAAACKLHAALWLVLRGSYTHIEAQVSFISFFTSFEFNKIFCVRGIYGGEGDTNVFP